MASEMELSVSFTFDVRDATPDAVEFDREAAAELLDEVEHALVGQQNNLVFQAVEHAHEQLEAYGGEHEYRVESVIESFAGVTVDRNASSIKVTWGWSHPAAEFFEFGTSDHTIEGDPVLSFVWSEPPAWVREEFDQARGSGGQFASGWRVFLPEVEVSGLPEARFARSSQHWLRRQVQA